MASTKKQSNDLIELADEFLFFCDLDGDPHARVYRGGHVEVHRLDELRFRQLLMDSYRKRHKQPPTKQALTEAIEQLAATASLDGNREAIHTRVGSKDGNVYLDLANDDYQVVEITPEGWSLTSTEINFRRSPTMRSLPAPTAGGQLSELAGFVNTEPDEHEWILFCSWLLSCLMPNGPYPVLAIYGPPGSAKTTTTSFLRSLVDPNQTDHRSFPRSERDLVIAARNQLVCSFDNVSGLGASRSDWVCRLSTGSGFSTRRLYSNAEEQVFNLRRPVILNGIEEPITRADLADRALIVELPAIPATKRRTTKDLMTKFEAARPRLLGSLLDAAALAVAAQDQPLTELSRMADTMRWVTAAEPAFATRGGVKAAFEHNRADIYDLTLEASPIAAAVQQIAQKHFLGSSADLLKLLRGHPAAHRNAPDFPKDPTRLSAHLRLLAAALANSGITVQFNLPLPAQKSRRGIRINAEQGTRDSVSSVTSVTDTTAARSTERGRDAKDAGDAVIPLDEHRRSRRRGSRPAFPNPYQEQLFSPASDGNMTAGTD